MRAKATAVLLLAAAALRAADTPPPKDDSLADAKKAFDSLKAPAVQESPALPALDMKDIGPQPGRPQAAPEPPLPVEALPDPSKKRKTTGNWLVDAMDAGAAEQRRGRETGGDVRRAAEPDGARDLKDGELGSRAAYGDRDLAPPAAHDKGVNPLDAFIGSWLSARDHDLLLATARAPAAARGGDELLPGLEPVLPADAAAAPSPAAFVPVHDLSAEPNPYVAAMEALQAPAHGFTLPEVPGFSPASLGDGPLAPPASAQARPADAARGVIPEFALPSDDDKYFKQLKRF